jgi:hypothetical protein
MTRHANLSKLAALLLPLACAADDPLGNAADADIRTCGSDGAVMIFAGAEPDAGGEPESRVRVEQQLGGGRLLVASGTKAGGSTYWVVGDCGGEAVAVPNPPGARVWGDATTLWFADDDVVGRWSIDGGSDVQWEPQGDRALAFVPGVGLAIWEVAGFGEVGDAVLLDAAGSRRPLFSAGLDLDDPFFDMLEITGGQWHVQVTGTVIGVLDDSGTLRVVDATTPGAGVVTPDIRDFGLGPDGSWFIAQRAVSGEPLQLILFDRATGIGTDIGQTDAFVGPVPGPYVGIQSGFGPTTELVDSATLARIPVPARFGEAQYLGGGRFVDADETASWDPSTGQIVEGGAADDGQALFLPGADVPVRERRLDTRVGESPVVPFDGAPFSIPGAERLRGLATGHVLFADGGSAVGSPVGVAFEVGPVYVAAPGMGPARLESAAGLGEDDVVVLEGGDIVLEVQDGARSGLWRYGLR